MSAYVLWDLYKVTYQNLIRIYIIKNNEKLLLLLYFSWLQLLYSFFFLFPHLLTAEKWSFASPALSSATLGELPSYRGQPPNSEPHSRDPESPKAKAEVTGKFSVGNGDKGLLMLGWGWTIRGSWGTLGRLFLSAVQFFSCSSAFSRQNFWSMNDFSSSCWYTFKMSHSCFYLCSSPLRLIGVK